MMLLLQLCKDASALLANRIEMRLVLPRKICAGQRVDAAPCDDAASRQCDRSLSAAPNCDYCHLVLPFRTCCRLMLQRRIGQTGTRILIRKDWRRKDCHLMLHRTATL